MQRNENEIFLFSNSPLNEISHYVRFHASYRFSLLQPRFADARKAFFVVSADGQIRMQQQTNVGVGGGIFMYSQSATK